MQTNLATKNAKQAKTEIKYRLTQYDWADSLLRNGIIKGPVLHTLKAIIACKRLKQPTLEQLNKARTKSSTLKFAQATPISVSTIKRHIHTLETLKYITVDRQTDAWYSRNQYTVNSPEYKLATSPQLTMDPSLSSFSQSRERKAASFPKLAASTRVNIAQAKDWAQSHVAKMEGTELLGEALVALEGQGLVKPKRGSLTDRLFILALEDFNVFLSAKLLELEQKRALL